MAARSLTAQSGYEQPDPHAGEDAWQKENPRQRGATGLIDGDWAFNTWGGGDAEQYDGLKKMFSEQTPLGRVVTPDVADSILALITGSDYVTGQLVD